MEKVRTGGYKGNEDNAAVAKFVPGLSSLAMSVPLLLFRLLERFA
jgi:hypothetical protein